MLPKRCSIWITRRQRDDEMQFSVLSIWDQKYLLFALTRPSLKARAFIQTEWALLPGQITDSLNEDHFLWYKKFHQDSIKTTRLSNQERASSPLLRIIHPKALTTKLFGRVCGVNYIHSCGNQFVPKSFNQIDLNSNLLVFREISRILTWSLPLGLLWLFWKYEEFS